jgi:hypothetical protein
VVVSATGSKVPGTHVGLEQQQIVVGLELAQLGAELGRLKVFYNSERLSVQHATTALQDVWAAHTNTRIVQAGLEQDVGVVLRLHIVVRRVRQHVLVLVLHKRIAPLLPFADSQRKVLVQQRADHINKRLCG